MGKKKLFYPFKVQKIINVTRERHSWIFSFVGFIPYFTWVVFQLKKPYMHLNINAEKSSTILMQSLLTAGDILSEVFEIAVNK